MLLFYANNGIYNVKKLKFETNEKDILLFPFISRGLGRDKSLSAYAWRSSCKQGWRCRPETRRKMDREVRAFCVGLAELWRVKQEIIWWACNKPVTYTYSCIQGNWCRRNSRQQSTTECYRRTLLNTSPGWSELITEDTLGDVMWKRTLERTVIENRLDDV